MVKFFPAPLDMACFHPPVKAVDNERPDGKDMIMDVEHTNGNQEGVHNVIPTTPPSTVMSTANLFSTVTCVSFILSIPLALIMEGNILHEISNSPASNDEASLGPSSILSVLLHFLNNEEMYLVIHRPSHHTGGWQYHETSIHHRCLNSCVCHSSIFADWNRIGDRNKRCPFVRHDETSVRIYAWRHWS